MKKKVLKVVNPEIGIELYNLLISHQLFTDNIKAIAAAYNLLKQMAYKQHKENDCWFKHYSKAIEQHFRNYTNGNYCQFLKALKELQLIDYDENGFKYFKDKSKKGDCRQYLLSSNCLRLLKESNREWLKKLNTDKIIMRKTQKSISQRKVYSKKYNEPIFDYIHDGLINISYDYIDAEVDAEDDEDPDEQGVEEEIDELEDPEDPEDLDEDEEGSLLSFEDDDDFDVDSEGVAESEVENDD